MKQGKKYIALNWEDQILYAENKSPSDPYPQLLDSGRVILPYTFKERIDGFRKKKQVGN